MYGFAAAAMFAMLPAAASAQQYVTDDAAITEDRACQIQMWHGERSSWVLPVCTPIRNLELSLGFIAVWDDGSDGHFEYVAQLKTVLRPMTPNGWGAGFVLGTGRDPAFAGTGEKTSTIYSYVPVSVSLGGERLVLHQNVGWLYERTPGRDQQAFTWALRADARVRSRVTAVLEFYGLETGVAGRAANAEYQAGLRTWFRKDRVQVDLSYGGKVQSGRAGQGWTLGLTLMTPPFL